MSAQDVVFVMPSAAPLLVEGEPGPAGGAETQVVLLARELAARGHRIAIVAHPVAGHELRRQVDGVDVIAVAIPRTRMPVVRTLAYYRSLFGALRAHPSPVVVQRAAGIHTLLAGLAARALRRRFVYASAGLHDFDLGSWERKRWIVGAFRLGLALAGAIVVQTEEQARRCRARFGREATVIASIAEPAAARSGPGEAFLWIGTLAEPKRPLALVALARAVPEARFRMVGVPAGPRLAAEVHAAAAATDNLEPLAPRPRAALGPLLDEAVAVVSTSRSEGMPNVLLEGWSRGVPALTLAHDPDGVITAAGLGACAGDSGERLAALARELWAGRADAAELAARCRAHVGRVHAPGPVADRWAAVLGLGPGRT